MKTKKLIELLQKEDPSGDTEVCVYSEDGNVDILCLEGKPGYWDGCYQILERNWASPYYNVIGAQYRSDGDKIMIRGHSIIEALDNNPNLPITVVDTFIEKRMQKAVDKWRSDAKNQKEHFEKQCIQEFSYKVLSKVKEGWKIVQPATERIGKYNVMWYVKDSLKFVFDGNTYKENDNQKHFCQGECKAVLESGFFVPETKDNLVYWNLIFKKD